MRARWKSGPAAFGKADAASERQQLEAVAVMRLSILKPALRRGPG